MDITPKQFNALLVELKKIREHIEQLRNEINEHRTATLTAAKKKEPEPAPQVRAELHLPEAVEDAITRRTDGPNWWQKASVSVSAATALFTALAFAAAFWYACEAHKQSPAIVRSADAAKDAAQAARDQASLLRQQIILSSSAVVDVSPTTDGALVIGRNRLRMSFTNVRAPATDVRTEYQIIKQVPPDGRHVGKDQQPPNIEFAELPPTDPKTGSDWKEEATFELSPKEFEDINNGDLTVTVKGSLHYWNGYETTNRDFCFHYYGFDFSGTGKSCGSVGDWNYIRCDSYPHLLESARIRKKDCLAGK